MRATKKYSPLEHITTQLSCSSGVIMLVLCTGLQCKVVTSVKPQPNDCNMPMQHITTLLGATCCVRLATVLRHVGCCWLKFANGQNRANNTQHVATHRYTVAKRMQHVVPNNVAICCVGMLRSFGRGFMY